MISFIEKMKINLFKYSNKHHGKLQKDNNNNKVSDKIKRMNKLRKWIFFWQCLRNMYVFPWRLYSPEKRWIQKKNDVSNK